MVVEKEVIPFTTWLFPSEHGYGALITYVALILLFGAVATLIGYLTAAVRYGPIEAFFRTCKVLFNGFGELIRIRPGRLWAMTRLAFQEAIRRRILVGFAVFVLVLLLGGWMLNRGSDHPARLNISFVLTSTNYLVLVMALFLSTFSLPRDIRNRTIHTVVTKPVLAWEIVLGRILGFIIVGSVMLAAMAVCSYLFVDRGLSHTHKIDSRQLTSVVSEAGQAQPGELEGETSLHRRLRHRHAITLDERGMGYTEYVKDHRHPVVATGSGDDRTHHVGPAEGWLQARVPIYGRLSFLNRRGRPIDKGVNVGNEWTYRSFIEGGPNSRARAIWRFQGISETMFPDDGLPVEMTIRVFRTHKGDVEQRIWGSIVLVNPHTGLESVPRLFQSSEFTVDQHFIPRKLKTPEGKEIDLFNDLVSGGELEIQVKCEDRQQYFGMADADLYFRAADGWFWVNFFKGYLSIWFQMVLVICFGVTFSAIVSGPVAAMATLASIVIGYFAEFTAGVASGKIEGGGPLESMYRLFTQKNVVSELDPGAAAAILHWSDVVLVIGMRIVTALLPDYASFDTSTYVANGYYIQAALVGQHFFMTVGYMLALTVLGYFLFRTREIAA